MWNAVGPYIVSNATITYISLFFLCYRGNASSQLIPYFLNSKIISGSVIRDSNESFNGHVTIRLEHTQVCTESQLTAYEMFSEEQF